MTEKRLNEIIIEEVNNYFLQKEEVTPKDEKKIRDMIRDEIADVFFDLFKKRASWK